jgi:homoserine O-acetyltransferase
MTVTDMTAGADAALSTEPPAWRLPSRREFIARDFRFGTGEVLPELRLRYTVLGNPAGHPVLVLHGTSGSGSRLLTPEFGGALFGPGQVLDAARHFIVLPDAIGHGGSAKPSDGLRAAFPSYDYDDMVRAQHLVVTEALGLRHLRAVLGVSMGGMHAWLWGIRYPGFMDALIPMACQPAPMSGRNWMLRRLLIDAIRSDPQWAKGDYVEQPAGVRAAWEFFNVATNGGALALLDKAPNREAADRWLASRRATPLTADANDLLYQWSASRDYDPTPGLGRITARVLAINSADDERNPPEAGIVKEAVDRLPDARYLLLPAGRHTRGHATVAMAALWADACRAFLEGDSPA